jgi:hypothetical protein
MTKLQLWMAIALPSILIVVAWLSQSARFSGIDARLDRSDRRFDAIDRRLDAHDKRFDDVIASGHRDALEIMRAMTALHERVAVVEAKQDS